MNSKKTISDVNNKDIKIVDGQRYLELSIVANSIGISKDTLRKRIERGAYDFSKDFPLITDTTTNTRLIQGKTYCSYNFIAAILTKEVLKDDLDEGHDIVRTPNGLSDPLEIELAYENLYKRLTYQLIGDSTGLNVARNINDLMKRLINDYNKSYFEYDKVQNMKKEIRNLKHALDNKN